MSRPSASRLGLAIALVLSSPLLAQDVLAQDAPNTAKTLDTVIVTGTRAIDRTVLESTSPVDVLTAEDIRKAGVVNGELGSALQALLPSFNFPRQSNSGGADHIRAAQLRGLSPDQVLVLVNGKRRHSSALVNTDSKIGKGTTPVDFNAIPVSAIKRIEVLRDGAGALYGSDAVAGVINVILDDAPEGGAFEASFGANHTDLKPIDRTITDGQTSYASAKVGTVLGDKGGFLRVGLELKNHEGTNRAGFDQIPPWDQTPTNLALQGKRQLRAWRWQDQGSERLVQRTAAVRRNLHVLQLRHLQPARQRRRELLPLPGQRRQLGADLPERLPPDLRGREPRRAGRGRCEGPVGRVELRREPGLRRQHLHLPPAQLAQRLAGPDQPDPVQDR